MSNPDNKPVEASGAEKASLSGYLTGYVLSIVCTLVAYGLVWLHLSDSHQTIGHGSLAIGLIFLAILQFFVQAVYFLHLGRESAPRWNAIVFSFMITVVVILVAGSLWIMTNLDYRHEGHNMTPNETEQHLLEEEGFEQSDHH